MKVSVIIPVYNVEKYLEKAVSSALKQPETGEIILIDDGSTDKSLAMCRNLSKGHSIINVFTHADNQNKGSAATRNIGIKNAHYDIIAFLDSDDLWLENRFVKTKKIFEENPDIDGVYEAVENFFEENAVSYSESIPLSSVPKLHMVSEPVKPENLLEHLLIKKPYDIFLLQGLCVKKNIFEKSGLFDEEYRVSQDMLMIKKMAASARLMHGDIQKPVSIRRIHTTNISYSKFKEGFKKRFEEGETLLKWGLNKKLSSGKLNIILTYQYRMFFGRKELPFNAFNRLRWMVIAFINYPHVIYLNTFWSTLPILGRLTNKTNL